VRSRLDLRPKSTPEFFTCTGPSIFSSRSKHSFFRLAAYSLVATAGSSWQNSSPGKTSTTRVLDRAPQGLAVTDQLVEIGCATRDLGNCPITDGGAESGHDHLQEEIAERVVRGRSAEFKPQRLGQNAVVTDGKTLQVPQALATTEDAQHRHQQQIPGREPHPASHARDRIDPSFSDTHNCVKVLVSNVFIKT
jgi:hypothetical protein